MTRTVTTEDLRFVCDDPAEVYRAESLYTKEPGTIAWLRSTIRPGDVFYDIGANIGCYSLVAARLGARVYAFEPHLLNAAHLLRNVAANGLAAQITVVLTPLHDQTTFARFTIGDARAGTSHHHFGRADAGVLVLATSIDHLVEDHLPHADVVKLDVDGNEYAILHGMSAFLYGPDGPRSLQVEMPPADDADIRRYLTACGYTLTSRHYTQFGQQALARGVDPATITDNAIFARRPS